VAVLSHEFWQREYGAGTEALGKTIHLDGQPFQIVGVTPPSFFGLVVGSRFDVAVPLAAEPIIRGENSVLDRPTFWWLLAAGRARRDLMPQQMGAQLATISRPAFEATVSPSTREPYRSQYLERVFTTWPMDTGVSNMRRTYTKAVWLLMGVVGMVLLIACANIANLLLARAAARQKEMGVRLALGASRRRLVQQLLTESLLLAAAGTALAIPLARWAGDLLVAQIGTPNFPVFLDLALDWSILTFVAGTALLTTLLFGLAPALRATRVSLAEAMKQAGPGEADRRRRFGLGRVLVVGQVAVSLVLLAGAALLLRSFHNLTALDTGFEAERVLIAELDLRRAQTRLESRAEA
jgi:predicted permease